MITMNMGTRLFPRALEAAMVQSIKAETPQEKPMMVRRLRPAVMTSGSAVNRDKNCFPKITKSSPIAPPMPKEYSRLIRQLFNTRSRFPAPRFWLIKLAHAVQIAAITSQIRPSEFAAAEFPATIVALKELTPTCTNRFARAKIAFCRPEGIPIFKMSMVFDGSGRSFDKCSL